LSAAIFVVLHLAAGLPPRVSERLARHTALPVKLAEDGEALRHGQIYLAPADHHLLVKDKQVGVVHGARENLCRPAIDPLFRSAAVHYGPRVIGVILTGLLDDGTAGLVAIKRCGGKVIVQTPTDAAFPDMPTSALAHVAADYTVPVAVMGDLLTQLITEPAGVAPPVPEDLLLENQMVERMNSRLEATSQLGDQVPVTCPECGGPLWEMKSQGPCRYRCSIGHAYTAQALVTDQSKGIEEALWYALRTLEERANMLTRLAATEERRGHLVATQRFQTHAAESRSYAQRIRALLQEGVSEPTLAA